MSTFDQYVRPTVPISWLTLVSKVFGADSLLFQHIPELVNRYLMPPDPIILHYTVDPAVPPPERPSAWDVEVKTEDGAMKNRMTTMVQTSKESAQELTKLDEEVRSFFFFNILRLLTRIIDCIARTITPQFTPQTDFPPIILGGPCPIHPDVASVPITGLREHIG